MVAHEEMILARGKARPRNLGPSRNTGVVSQFHRRGPGAAAATLGQQCAGTRRSSLLSPSGWGLHGHGTNRC